jgi:hypothetical protein
MIHNGVGVVSICRTVETPRGAQSLLVLAPSFPRREDMTTIFVRQVRGAAHQFRYAQSSIAGGIGLSHVAVWLPPDIIDDDPHQKDVNKPLLRLADKIEKKIAQTRDARDVARIVVVNTWIADQIGRADPALVERVRRKLVDAHDRVAAILLVLRKWDDSLQRFRYVMQPLLSQPVGPLPAMIAKMQDAELS